MNKEYKKCGYTNCEKDISNLRKNAKYCCRKETKFIEHLFDI
jgi:hypothetical protein